MQPGRRHRTASENEQEVSNAENENENEVNCGASDNAILDVDMQNGGENEHVSESGSDENESDNNESESDMNDSESGNDENESDNDTDMDDSDSESDMNDNSDDNDTDMNDNSDDNDTDMDDNSDDTDTDNDMYTDAFANRTGMANSIILQQLQAALLNANGLGLNIDQLRDTFSAAISHSSSSTHSAHITQILQQLPPDDAVAPAALLYAVFTEIWELVVLTGEEVEPYEFDSVIDLKPLLKHLIRVLGWEEEDCRVYGSEFLLYAIRCIRAITRYSPQCSKRLVQGGLLPLLTRQLESVEYIDLAEDLIQIFVQVSAQSKELAKACLEAQGIRAVLAFVDFLALDVQISAFTAAAQMAVALQDSNARDFLTGPPLQTLHSVIINNTDNTHRHTDTAKLTQTALQAICNALTAAPSLILDACPCSLLTDSIIPLAPILPAQVADIVAAVAASKHFNSLPLILPLSTALVKSLLEVAASNESLIEQTLKLILTLFANHGKTPALKTLLPGHSLTSATNNNNNNNNSNNNNNNNNINNNSNNNPPPPDHEKYILQVSQDLLNFYLNSPSIGLASRHSILVTLLLLDDAIEVPTVDLVKMGSICHLLASKDPLIIVIALEWCRILCVAADKCKNDSFIQISKRQGLPSTLQKLSSLNLSASPLSDKLKTWLNSRNKELTDSIGSDDNDPLSLFISLSRTFILSRLLQDKSGGQDNNENVSIANEQEEFSLDKLIASVDLYTEFEWLGDPKTCLARRLLEHLKTKGESSRENIPRAQWESICLAIYRALDRFDTVFKLALPLARPSRGSLRGNPMDALAIFARPLRINLKWPSSSSQKQLACDPFANISWIVKMAQATESERASLLQESLDSSTLQDPLSSSEGNRKKDLFSFVSLN
jgi:hypothetical protein